MIASMTFGMRSMSFWLCSIGHVFQTCSSAFFHMCIVRLWLAFFHASLNPLVLPKKPVRIQFPQADSHDFAGDSRFLHGPHKLEKHQHHETDGVPMSFSLTPGISSRCFLPWKLQRIYCATLGHCPWSKAPSHFLCTMAKFFAQNLPHNWIVHFFMLKMPPSNHFTSFVCSSFISTLVIVVSKFHLSLVIFVNFKSSVLWWFWPKVHHRKSAFFEMEKKIENRKSAGGGRDRPELSGVAFGHHHRNIWHLSIKKLWYAHRFWEKYRRPKGGLFMDNTVPLWRRWTRR